MSQHAKSKSPVHGAGWWRTYAIGGVVCAALTAASYLFGIEPAMARHDAALAEQAEFDARQQKQHDLDRSLAATHRQLEKTRKDVAGLPLQLESASAVNRRLARLADLAGETGVVLDEVQPSPAVDGAFYQTVPIRIGGSGSYPACAMFLHRLRDRFPDTAVKSFDCSNPGPIGDHPTAKFKAELAWYTTPTKK
jgi:hypothetical protein